MKGVQKGRSVPMGRAANGSTHKLLAFTQRRIPYLPELKVVCGSVCASILMQQLEYWFANHVDGFYKFLEPCQHPQYKPQDSWTEELHFTLREFRGAFDKIGVRYKSKKQLQTVLELGEDPFQGSFYLSTVEVRSGLTLYHRNHLVVDAMLEYLLNDYCSNNTPNNIQSVDSNRDDVLSFPEMTKARIQKCRIVISGNDTLSSPYKEQKTTARDDTKKTAATQAPIAENSPIVSHTTPPLAAAVKNKKKEFVIENTLSDALTPLQRRCVKRLLPGLLSHVPGTDAATLEAALAHTLCDPEAFTRAGPDFFKKLNTLQKAIRQGRWQIPVVLQEKKQQAVEQHAAKLQRECRELRGEEEHLAMMVESLHQQGKMALSEQIEGQ